jgi:hypothetical protein
LSDMVNLTRAKDAAIAIVLRILNCETQEKALGGAPIRGKARRAPRPQCGRRRIHGQSDEPQAEDAP